MLQGHKVLQDQQVLWVILDQQVQQDHKVEQGDQDPPVQLDPLVIQDQQVTQVLKVALEDPDRRVPHDPTGLQEDRDRKALKDQQVPQALMDLQVPLEEQDHKAQ